MTFTLPKLPYDYDALGPHLSADTLKFHHDKHHKAYVDKLNKAIEGTPYSQLSLGEIIQKSWRKDWEVFNNAGQHWNHAFFWNCLTPDGGGQPSGDLKRQIEKDFGDLAAFQKEFADKARDIAVRLVASPFVQLSVAAAAVKSVVVAVPGIVA